MEGLEPLEGYGSRRFWRLATATVAAALLVVVLLAGRATSSPIPKRELPKLTAAMLVGRWEYDWGQMQGGWIEFYPDGRYASRHDRKGELWYQPRHAGGYEVRDGMLILTEGMVIEDQALIADRPYAIVVTLKEWPAIIGECGTTPVKFSNRIYRGKP